MQGAAPPIQTALELYNVLSKSDTASLRQPVGLEQQLLKDKEMDSEVGQSMLQLLKVLLLPLPSLIVYIKFGQSMLQGNAHTALSTDRMFMLTACLCCRYTSLHTLQ